MNLQSLYFQKFRNSVVLLLLMRTSLKSIQEIKPRSTKSSYWMIFFSNPPDLKIQRAFFFSYFLIIDKSRALHQAYVLLLEEVSCKLS